MQQQNYHGNSCSNIHWVDIIAIDKWVETGRCRREAVSPLPLLVRCNSLEVRDWLWTHAHACKCLAAINQRKNCIFQCNKTKSKRKLMTTLRSTLLTCKNHLKTTALSFWYDTGQLSCNETSLRCPSDKTLHSCRVMRRRSLWSRQQTVTYCYRSPAFTL